MDKGFISLTIEIGIILIGMSIVEIMVIVMMVKYKSYKS